MVEHLRVVPLKNGFRSGYADAFVDFALDMDGHIREMRMRPVSPLTDFSFDFQDLRRTPVPAGKADSRSD